MCSFTWNGEIFEIDGWYKWEIEIPDETAAQRVLPLDLFPGDTYNHVWGGSKHPMDWKAMREQSNHALQNGLNFYSQEYRCFDRYGEIRWIHEEVRLKCLEPGHWEAHGICTDVTDCKRADSALNLSDETYENFFLSPGLLRGIVELHGDDIFHLAANEEAAAFFGLTPETIRHRWASEIGTSLELRQKWIQFYRECQRANRAMSFEFSRELPSGIQWFCATLSPIETDRSRFGYAVHDVTEWKCTEAALRESESRFREAMIQAPLGKALVSLDGYFMNVNPALCESLGYTEEELTRLTYQEITHPDDLNLDLENVDQLRSGQIPHYHMEKRYFHKDGHVVSTLLSVSLVRNEEGAPLYFICQIQDITQQKQHEAELSRLNEDLYRASRLDHLTGLRNRLRLQEDLEDLQHRYERYGRAFCIGICDLDNFKAYNDHYGHLAGDLALKRVAEIIHDHCRSGDTAYRFGGEEFLLIFPEQNIRSAKIAMERIRSAVEVEAIPHEGERPGGILTLSGGIAGITCRKKKTLDQLLSEADKALYRSKQTGKNRIST